MKSRKDFKCGGIVPIVDIKKGENSQIFDEITIRASPPIYFLKSHIREKLNFSMCTENNNYN